MTKDEEQKAYENVRQIAQRISDKSKLAGMKVICGLVLEKAEDKTKTDSEKITDIVSFCKRSLAIKGE